MAVSFSSLLKKPIAEAKKPPPLPAGTYQGIVAKYETGDNNKNKTPYVRIFVNLTEWPEDVHEQDKEGIELSKKQQRTDFYLTEDSIYRLAEFIHSCGVKAQDFEEALPQIIGSTVLIEITQTMNQETSEIYNQVKKMVGQV